MSSFPKKFVVDTNVPITANKARDPKNIPSDLIECVAKCIETINEITTRKVGLVIDLYNEIFNEYKKHLCFSGQPGVGDAFMKWVHDNQGTFPVKDRVAINRDGDSYLEFPTTLDLSEFDPADRKFVAVAKAHPAKPPILQATDSKWWGWKDALAREGVTVTFLCPDYVAVHYAKKKSG